MSETSTKERPILMNGEMVRATLDDRKGQTRRVMKPQPDVFESPVWQFGDGHSGAGWYCAEEECPDEGSVIWKCPYGKPGDRLWVRETQSVVDVRHGRDITDEGTCHIKVRYEASGTLSDWLNYPERLRATPVVEKKLDYGGYRESSRLDLGVTKIRVERLQDISDSDIESEGLHFDFTGERKSKRKQSSIRRHYFAELWDSINKAPKKPGHDWNSNPWVWVVEFKRLESQA